ncbi:draxin [Microcaecilia unicolor]|uniref:Draxin n=1 Tax=Microcaecilia unicolor TaxID=1415580 RepID=A0A6P7WLP5_9AMPH|nr:draxin [Microcaecilia unicolor]
MRIFPSSSVFPVLFFFILMIHDITQVWSLEPATQKPRKISERKNPQKQELWLEHHRRGHRYKQGILKNSRSRGPSSRAQGPIVKSPWLPKDYSVREEMDKVSLTGAEFLHPERENHHKHQMKQYRDHISLLKDPSVLEKQSQNIVREGTAVSDIPTNHIGQTAASTEGSSAVSPRPQVHRRKDGDVMPTLDMTLFDWTDYEDLKPESWPLDNKKEKRRKKTTGNETVALGEACDHHLDCLPGSCCDLREHICKLHSRGLNNKCYDDCMCTDGLRCYAKFHRNGKVRRRKGRCVEPESITSDQGSFITV